MTQPFVHTMRVRYRDTDSQGHVYFGNYFEFCDEAYSAYMRAMGMPWQEMVRGGTDMFYASATCDYLGSARFEDTIHIEARVSKIGKECHTKCAIYNLVGDCVMPREGIFCEVLQGGTVRRGDGIERC